MKFGVKAENEADMSVIEGKVIESYSRPLPRKQPRRAGLVQRVLAQVYGGLAGDAFVTHTITPKPMSKRRRRRLRGKAKGIARELRTDYANRPELYRKAAVLQMQLKAHDNDWQF